MTSQFPKIGAFCRVRIFALFGLYASQGFGAEVETHTWVAWTTGTDSDPASWRWCGQFNNEECANEGRLNWGFGSIDKDLFRPFRTGH